MRTLGRWLLVMLAIIGGISSVVFVALFIMVDKAIEEHSAPKTVSIDQGDYLILELDRNLNSGTTDNPLELLTSGRGYNYNDMILTLRQAAKDPKIDGVVARLGGRSFSPATAQELADTMAEFRKSGKTTLLYSESLHGGLPAIAVASSFEHVWLQPSGMYGLQGLAIEAPYLESMLNDYGIEAEFIQRHEYKGAMEFLTQNSMTAPVKSNMSSLLNSLSGSMMELVANGRKIPVETVKALAETGPLLAEDAQKNKLVDRLAYTGEFNKFVKDTFSGKGVSLQAYSKSLPDADTDKTIALITASGQILPGDGEAGPFADQDIIFARPVSKAIRDAAKDKVGAILLRINSPGGDYAGSDTIYSAILDAREAGVPVIVSMGDTAASGGYFIAAAADTIIAEPTTITGSIGVIGGKVSLSGLWDKLGINWTTLKTTQTADMWSSNHSFTATERAWMNRFMDAAYKDFTGKVATGRKLTPEAVDAIARGRVFSGQDAKAKGLVDDLGGLYVALQHAKRSAGIPAEQQAEIISYPRKRSLQENLMLLLEGEETDGLIESKLRTELPQPIASLYLWSKMNLSKGAAVMPPFTVH